MKIYVITKGCYSDYHIVAATTDYEKATKIKTLATDKWDDAYIETYDDAGFYNNDDKLKKKWFVCLEDTLNAEICSCESSWCLSSGDDKIKRVRSKQSDGFNKYCYQSYIFADTNKQAEKIFLDKLTEYKAKKEGIC